MCSHSIAAAADNNLLKQYLDTYSHFVKTPAGHKRVTPNFTRVSMNGLPRGTAGRKGNKAAKQKAIKCRKVEENQKDVPLPKLSTINDGACVDTVESVPPFHAGESYSSTNASSYLYKCYPYCPLPPGPSNYSTNSFNYRYPFSEYAPPWYFHQPSYPTFSSGVSSYSNAWEPMPLTPTSTFPLVEPFIIKFLNGRIKICTGCKGTYMKGSNGKVLKPPKDICISHKEQIVFTNPHSGLQSSKEGNCYYHVNKSCILKKHPNFSPSQLVCSEDVNLEDSHKKLLQETLDFLLN